MAALTFKVGGDTSGLARSLKGVKGLIGGLGGLARNAALGGLAVGASGAAVAMVGLKKALNLGGRLSDVASNTGLLAGQALVLERALQDAGISGEKLQPTILKMQRAMVEAGEGVLTYRRAFEALGLELGELRGLNTAEQFAAIQEALAAVEDPAERSARAMQIFGKSGGELGALFSNADAMANAMRSVGGQAAILDEAAGDFDRSADLLGGMGSKFSAFFVGLAKWVNPILLPALEEVNKLDLTKFGEQAGRSIAMLVEAFNGGAVGKVVELSFMIAGAALLNFLAKGFLGIGSAMGALVGRLGNAFEAAMLVLVNPSFWSNLGTVLKSLGTLMAISFIELLPSSLRGKRDEAWAETQKILKGADLERASDNIANLDRGIYSELGDVAGKMGQAFVEQMRGEGLRVLNTDGEKNEIKRIIEGLGETVDANKKGERFGGFGELVGGMVSKISEISARAGAVVRDGEEPGGLGVARAMKPIVSSFGRIGGASLTGGRRGERMDVDRNRLLKSIEENTRGGGGVARFA